MTSGQMTSLLIISLFPSEQKWVGVLITMISPYISRMIGYIINKFNQWYYPTTVSIKFTQTIDKKGVPLDNFNYKAICWHTISEHYDKQKTLLCEFDSIKKNEKVGDTCKKIPIYIPNNSYKVNYNKNTVSISFNKNSAGNSVIIRSTSMITLTNFVSYVGDLYSDHCYNNLDPKKIYVCTKKQPRYTSSPFEFEGNEMTVNKTYSNVYLPSVLMNSIKEDIKKFKTGEQFYKDNGIPYKRGYLFYGPPGTGKSSIAYAISRETGMNLYILDSKNDMKGSNVNIKQIVKKIPSGSVVLLDEADMQIYNDRPKPIKRKTKTCNGKEGESENGENNGENGENSEDEDVSVSVVNQRKGAVPMSDLMNVLDGYDTLHGCIIILITNHKEFLDEALIRPGRIDMHYHFGEMESEDIKRTIKRFAGYDIDVPSTLTMTSSTLINKILLPHRGDKPEIQQHLLNQSKLISIKTN